MIVQLSVEVDIRDRAFREEDVRALTETAIRRELNWTSKGSVRDVKAAIVNQPRPEDRQLTLVP